MFIYYPYWILRLWALILRIPTPQEPCIKHLEKKINNFFL